MLSRNPWNCRCCAARRGGLSAHGDSAVRRPPKSIKALEVAMEAGKSILVAQKSAAKDEPSKTSIESALPASPTSCRCSSCPTAP